jgi:hypothetical protein
MAITTRDGLIAAQAAAQRVRLLKTTSRTSVAAIPFSLFDLAGSPGAGVLAGTSTAAGVVPTDATAGMPTINAFSGSAGYLSRVEASSPVACRLAIYDLLFKAGAYTFNADVTLAAQPSYSSRVIGGTDYKGTELWIEAATAFTGNQTVQINYLDQDGNPGDTGVIATGVAPILGRMFRLPLATGDTGVQRIDRVRSSISTVGTFNALVMRKLWEGRIRISNDQIVHGPDLTGLPVLFADSALILVVTPDSTATSLPEVVVDVING